MSPRYDHFEGVSIFDDKGETKKLVAKVIDEIDPEVVIDRMRKLDFSYIFLLTKKGRTKEIELLRSEIEASWEWRKGDIDKRLQQKIARTIAEF